MDASPLAYVISPQPWAGFHVSKHHYAIALADRGWRVAFVDPPTDLGKAGAIDQSPTGIPGITVLRYQTFFPYKIKFHARWAFDTLMQRQARRLVDASGRPDLIWDFDNAYQFRDLRAFGAKTSIFHLVDDVSQPSLGDKRADHFFYLHPSFGTRAGACVRTEHRIDHGLGKPHAIAARKQQRRAKQSGAPHVGFVGNLGAIWLDWSEIRRMVERLPGTRFTFWGPLPHRDATDSVLADLFTHPRVSFPGLASPEAIIAEADAIDVWLAPFHADKLPGGPLNSHKILEYLSTGKVVVMTRLEAYVGNPLVEMLPDGDVSGLADLLKKVLADLDVFNAPAKMEQRTSFALRRTYDRQLAHILSLVEPSKQAITNAA